MSKEKVYRSEASAAVHEIMSDLNEIGLVDKQTMRKFDESCLTEIREFSPADIKALREREQISQTVLARYMNMSTQSVSKWESGEKQPNGASLKLLALIDRKGLAAIA